MNNFAFSQQNPGVLYFNERLQNKLKIIFQKPLTVVEAPKGYGKTVAVLEFLRTESLLGGRSAWTQVAGNDENAFWRSLCKAVATAFPQEAGLAQALLAVGYPYDLARVQVTCELFRQVKITQRIVLVVDDYHLLPGREFGILCESLAVSGPKGLHIVLITRNQYHSSKSGSPPQSFFGYVGREVLALTSEEIAIYYAQCGVELSNEEADDLYRLTAGWISALYLYLLRYLNHGSIEHPEDLYSLVEQEVYAPLPQEAKDLLFTLCPVESFSLEQAIFLDSGEETESILQDLLQKNSFIAYDESSRTFAVHSILRSFLKERFGRLPVSQQRALSRRSGDWHMSQNEIFPAVAAYYAAGDYEKFLQILEANMTNTMVAESPHLFVRFFKTCPEEILDRHIGAKFKYAVAASSVADFPVFYECLAWLTEKCANLPEDDPESAMWRGELHVLSVLAEYNDLEAMTEHCRKANALLKGPSRLYDAQSTWSFGSPSVLFMFYRESGKLWEEITQLRESLPLYHNMISGHGAGCDYSMEAEALYGRGDFDAAEAACVKAWALGVQYEQLEVQICVAFVRMRLALAQGHWPEVERLLGETRDLIKRGRDYCFLHVVDLCKGAVYAFLGLPGLIPEWMKAEDSGKNKERLHIFACGSYYVVHGKAMLLAGEYAKVIELFESLLLDKHMFRHRLFEIFARLYLAAAYQGLGDAEASARELRRALKIALPDQAYMPFFENSDLAYPLLCAEAQSGVLKDEVAPVIELCEGWLKSARDIRERYFSSKG